MPILVEEKAHRSHLYRIGVVSSMDDWEDCAQSFPLTARTASSSTTLLSDLRMTSGKSWVSNSSSSDHSFSESRADGLSVSLERTEFSIGLVTKAYSGRRRKGRSASRAVSSLVSYV